MTSVPFILPLDMFHHGWAHHSIRTEKNKTPMQLWVLGLSSIEDENDDALIGLNVSILSCVHIHSLYILFRLIHMVLTTMSRSHLVTMKKQWYWKT